MTLSNPAQYISGRTVQEQMNSLIDYVDQRAAEVATDAIASDVAQVHSDAADAHTDALAAAASASQASTTLANAVKKTGEASQSIAGDIAVAGALSGGSVSSSGNVDGASIGSGATPVVCGDLTAFGSVSLGDTTLQGNLSVADPSALINLGGAGSVLVPAPTSNNEASTKKYADDALDNYAPMLRTTGSQAAAGNKYMNAVTYIGTAAASSDTGYSLIANLGSVSSACFAFIAVSRGGATIGAISIDGSGIPTYAGAGISGSTTFGIALKDGNMYIAMKRTGSTAQNYTINIYGITKGTSHYTLQPYDGNAPVEDVDSYTEACKI